MTLLRLNGVGRVGRVGPYEKQVLSDVSLSLASGDFVGVLGGRRAGKSTLIRIAAGLERADAGTVSFEGRDLATLTVTERAELRRTSIGVVTGEGPQSPGFTISEWVALPLHGHLPRRRARERALATLRQINLTECRDARWADLSDSERALASLANGIVRRPQLLLLDDPATGLIDTMQLREITGILRTTATATATAVLMTTASASGIAGALATHHLTGGALHPIAEPATILQFPHQRAAGKLL